MVKKRPKSKTAKQLITPTATRENSAIRETINDEMIAAAIRTIPQTVLMKVCRLCEAKDGPFLNIFDADKVTAKKIDEVMPFGVAENDDLPHKICFRCSAKVEELYEFIQKCIKTQESLRTAVGKRGPLIIKTKTRALWEEKLNKTNLSNDDICNALIKKAMEGIKDIPLNPLPLEEENIQPPNLQVKKVKGVIEPPKEKELTAISMKNNTNLQSEDEPDEVSLKQVKLTIEKCDEKIPLTRNSRFNKSKSLLSGLVEPSKKLKQYPSRKTQSKLVELSPVQNESTNDVKQTVNPNNTVDVKKKDNMTVEVKKKDLGDSKKVPAKVEEAPPPTPSPFPETPTPPPPPPINIMDHVSTIKVNGVGTLYLCKLCNRNFLKKEVVMTHGCAKNNVPKDNFMQNHVPLPEVPKPPTVKYIKMDNNFKKHTPETKPVEKKQVPSDCIRVNIPVQPETKNKPKPGPASKIKLQTRSLKNDVSKEPVPAPPPPPSQPQTQPQPKPTQEDKPIIPAVQFPGLPSLNSRYKLVPGPNNTFTLVEDSSKTEENPVDNKVPPPFENKTKKRKVSMPFVNQEVEIKKLKPRESELEPRPDVIDLDNNISEPPAIENPYPVGQPYPVGLFQTVPHHSGVFAPNTHPQPPVFTTPAMKKQSYTIVQTGNPSKLLISTKPQAVAEEPTRKKSKKSKPDANKEPFNVTLEDNAPPKDSGFFTFINVDPLLQPSYVLPTDNIIQESQISTSTPASKGILDNNEKEKYQCNMCTEKFSREKKLLSHIQSHYKQMDEEDQLRAEKASSSKKKSRKS